MKPEEAFQELIEKISLGKPAGCFVGTVSEVDTESGTATVERDDKPTLSDVKLNSVVDSFENSFTVFPAAGSKVLCIMVHNDEKEAAIVKYGEIDKIKANVGSYSLLLDSEGITMNGGENGGLIVLEKLLEGLDKNNQILQKIISVAASPVTEPGNGSASVFQAALNTALSSLSTGDFSDIENENVKH